ncbi:heme exporter protein CcmD [Roseovarius sp. M141]|uniref:heme exporter protein CcmD n=1 Tax=Roseovarius sp. M141 TaxID=2583806 RepID=UPI00337782A3|nr:heme exporter protein CcmD [Roseovarius sp. M141]
MPELGKYAFAVLSSYGISVAILAALCALSLMRARRMRHELAVLEQRMRRNG